MNIRFENSEFENTLLDARALKKRIDNDLSKNIYKRLFQLSSLCDSKEFFVCGLDNPHPLKGDLKGYIGWSIDKKYRLILSFNNTEKQDEVIVKGIVDYHGDKNKWLIA